MLRKKCFWGLLIVATAAAGEMKADVVDNDVEIADTIPMREVVVTGTRQKTDIRQLPVSVTVMGREQLTKEFQPSVLPTIMQQVPGLVVTGRGMMGYGVSDGSAGSLGLRGLGGNRNSGAQMLVLIDGHPQYQGVFGHGIADSYLTSMAERVEVLRGPASVLYGSNAMGGVINIVTRGSEERRDTVLTDVTLGAGSWGTVQAEASNQVRKGKFNSTASAHFNRSDNHRPNMGFTQYGGYLRLGYDFSQNWKIYADASVTHWNSSDPGEVSAPVLEREQWITRGTANLVVENHYDRTEGSISIYDNFGWHKINDGYKIGGGAPQTEFFRSKDDVAGISLQQSAVLFTGNRTTFGVDYQHIYGHAWYEDRESGETVTDRNNRAIQSTNTHENEVAAYIDFRQDIAKWLTLDAGLRYDHHSTAGGEWVPQAGIVVRPIKTGELKASFSKGFRNPTLKEMYLYPPANHDSLRAERILNYELSWRHRLIGGRLTYGINLFLIDGDNIIQTVNRRNVNSGEFKNKGIELEASYRVHDNWSLTTNHSLLDMETPVLGAAKYKGFLSCDYNSKRWSASLNVQYLGGLYTAVGANEKKENVCLLGASLSYRPVDSLRIWVRGENLLAQKYELNAGYPMPRATAMGGVSFTF